MTNFYFATVQNSLKSAQATISILQKAQAWSAENGQEEGKILQTALAPDMFPFVKQIQILSDNVKGMAARLAGTEAPKMEDNEQTLAELIQRLEKTVQFVESLPESSFEDAQTRQITLPFVPGKYLNAQEYALEFALPNIYFHQSMAYAILRSLGLQIGKQDYIGGLNFKDL